MSWVYTSVEEKLSHGPNDDRSCGYHDNDCHRGFSVTKIRRKVFLSFGSVASRSRDQNEPLTLAESIRRQMIVAKNPESPLAKKIDAADLLDKSETHGSALADAIRRKIAEDSVKKEPE